MIGRLSALATRAGNARRVLIGAGVLFLLAAAFGVPVTTILKSSNTDFQDPHAENQRVEKAIERATGQRAYFGVAALVPSMGDVRTDRAAQREAVQVASMLAAQPGFQRVLDYPATHLGELVSRDGRQTAVLAAFATQERSARGRGAAAAGAGRAGRQLRRTRRRLQRNQQAHLLGPEGR
jgi:hypothetical protein